MGDPRGDGAPLGGARGSCGPLRVAREPEHRGARGVGPEPGGQGDALRRGRIRHLRRASTTGTSTGAVDQRPRQLHAAWRRRAPRRHDARRGRPGGVGAGLYGMLVFAILAVFIAGLMVGRTPEYLGKKIQARRDEARGALPARRARSSCSASRGAVGALSASARVDPQPRRPRAHGGPLRLHVGRQQQRLGLRRPRPATPTGTTRPSGSRCSSAASS